MSCNSCENNCVQTLNVLQSNFNVNDTNTVDLTLSSGILSADVINDPNGGLTSGVNGEAIKLDPSLCNTLSISAAGLFASNAIGTITNLADVSTNFTVAATGSTITAWVNIDSYTNTSSCPQIVMYSSKQGRDPITAAPPLFLVSNVDSQVIGGMSSSYTTEGNIAYSNYNAPASLGGAGSVSHMLKVDPGQTVTYQYRLTTNVSLGAISTTANAYSVNNTRLVINYGV
jgi:hypothetical protein